MKNRTQKVSMLTFCLLWVTGLIFTPSALAESTSISVTGNGSFSENNANVSNDTQQTVQQTNNANITNNVSSNANTGDNNTAFNTGGDTAIKTGDATTVTQVSNEANKSVVEQNNCCQQSGATQVTVSGNGAFSDNHANVDSSNRTSVNVYQNANIVNNVTVNANTGYNSASFNTGGNTVIKTGNIKALNNVKTGPLNISYVSLPSLSKGNASVKIIGNGYGSWNTINLDEDTDTAIHVVNIANVINNLKANYTTGDNEAKFNTGGDIAILTGDITARTTIENGPINVSKVKLGCDCEKKEKEAPAAPTTPIGGNVPPPSQVIPQGPAPAAPIVHAFAGPILPVTGGNWMVLALFGNIMMLLLGAYLRLRSGRSPGQHFAF